MSNTDAIATAINEAQGAHSLLCAFWDDQIGGREISRQLAVGRFNRTMLDDRVVGYHAEKAHAWVAYGDLQPDGNIEGSLYLLRDEEPSLLRVRWAGSRGIYLGGTYLHGTQSNDGVTLKPSRLDSDRIIDITPEGVMLERYVAFDKRETYMVPRHDLVTAIEAVTEMLHLAVDALGEMVAEELRVG